LCGLTGALISLPTRWERGDGVVEVDERDERDEERGMYIVLLDCSEVNSLTVDGIYPIHVTVVIVIIAHLSHVLTVDSQHPVHRRTEHITQAGPQLAT
jgi:hypothetical protein